MFLLFFILWIVFNSAFTLEICLIGLVVAAVMFAFICKFMDYSIAKERHLMKKVFSILHYIFVLVKEVVKANFAVTRMIMSEQEEVEPALVRFQSEWKTPESSALLANAITLTPGTITVSLEGSEYVVHCLDESLAAGMDKSVFVELLRKIE